jgi:hypothetical protein
MSETTERHIRDLLKCHDELRIINWDFNLEHSEFFRELLNEIDYLREQIEKSKKRNKQLEACIGIKVRSEDEHQ